MRDYFKNLPRYHFYINEGMIRHAEVLKQHIEKCPKHLMSALKRENEELRADVEQLRRQEMDFENAEESVCPENVGFVEYIKWLRAEVERLKETEKENSELRADYEDAESGYQKVKQKNEKLRAEVERLETLVKEYVVATDHIGSAVFDWERVLSELNEKYYQNYKRAK